MANSALIDDLLKQFAENPRRVFARLANEYRKRGELDSAIEICRSHVPLQPGYISGHIVLGQALYDSGSLDEARSTFETALALDPENLIALRHMGDIARANGDIDGARRWYRQLLEIDPQNEEVAAQIESLGAPGAGAATSEATAEADAFGGWGDVTPETIDILTEEDAHDDGGSSAPAVHDAGADTSVATEAAADDADDTLVLDEAFEFPESTPADAVDEAVESPAPVASVEGLETTSFQGAEDLHEAALESIELDDLSIDVSEPMESAESFADAPTAPSAVAPLFPADSPDVGDETVDDAGANTFATETMAELYLQQGYPDRALAIYRELATRNPEDRSLQERIAELTEADEAPPAPVVATGVRTAREFFGVLAYRRAPTAAVAAPETTQEPLSPVEERAEWQGAASVAALDESESAETPTVVVPDPVEAAAESSSVDHAAEPAAVEGSVDHGDTAAEAPSTPAEARNGKPGREADTALSLDDVFRDSPVSEGSGSRSSLSFDEFFARRANGNAENAGEAETGAEGSSPDAERASDDEPKDLELFNAWLDGLKR